MNTVGDLLSQSQEWVRGGDGGARPSGLPELKGISRIPLEEVREDQRALLFQETLGKGRAEYEEAQKRRFQISHYIEDEKSKSEKAAKIEIAREMLIDDVSIRAISKYKGLT